MTYPLTSTDPHSPNMLMLNIRREMRAAGCYPGREGEYVVYLGKGAYSKVCVWRENAENPTVDKVPVRFSKRLASHKIKVEHV